MIEQPTVRQLHPTDLQTMADYGADCRDRLLGAGLPPTLHGAASCAGRQLEWLKPLVMGWRTDGTLVTGLAARLAPRNLLVIIADGERVAVQPIRPTTSVAAMCDEARKNETARYGTLCGQWIPEILRTALCQFGHEPALAMPPHSGGLFNATGVLLAAPEMQDLAPELDQMIAQDICPVLVGLLGRATSRRPDFFSAAWPLVLPLAPYLDALLAGFPKMQKETT
jgi:hypothetical protein